MDQSVHFLIGCWFRQLFFGFHLETSFVTQSEHVTYIVTYFEFMKSYWFIDLQSLEASDVLKLYQSIAHEALLI